MISLEQLSETDADAFLTETIASFVEELVDSGAGRDVAQAATDEFLAWLLPDGVQTAGHRFAAVHDDGRRVGRLWFGPRESPSDSDLFDIDIDIEDRDRGFGRSAIELVMSELRRSGADRLGLNVFESNTAAVALYESLGFERRGRNDGGTEMWLQLRPAS
ncbi:MAG: GNAT family N-acetyltransferase [Ilumatobacteraceae bacterium]